MDTQLYFSERQKFTQWWLWIMLLGVTALMLSGVYKQTVQGQPLGDQPMPDIGLYITTFIILGVVALFYNIRLDTAIREDGIYVRYIPFFFEYKKYPWEQISKAYIRKYRPIVEYGGWGVKYGFIGKGKAYNVSGNQGLQLELTDGSKLLIGTNKPDELNKALVSLGKV